jgi:hypothetical protein
VGAAPKLQENQEPQELIVGGTEAHLGSLQHQILTLVSEKKYEDAVAGLKAYKEMKKYYPGYAKRTDRLFVHAEELIGAIKNIKTLPNLATLSQNRQEEIMLRAKEHWEELKVCLRRLKTIEKDLELQDARSTVWVLKALALSAMIVLGAFIAREAFYSVGMPARMIIDQLIELLWSYII